MPDVEIEQTMLREWINFLKLEVSEHADMTEADLIKVLRIKVMETLLI